ncbi:MAG: BatA domain-containing protein, partial [Candidatus Neomarinimicrobiota bacterium]
LWALPVAAMPLVIHLISRLNTKVVDFSTLQFLRRMRHHSLRRLRWHHWLVILLRTLLLLLLVLLLSRPVIKGYYRGWMGEDSATLTVILMDDSFSISGGTRQSAQAGWQGDQRLMKEHLTALFDHLSAEDNQGRVVILRLSDARAVYSGSVAELPRVTEIANLCKPGYYQDNLAAVVDTLSSTEFIEDAKLFSNREIVILSDFQTHQQATLKFLGQDTAFWSDWHFFLMPLPSQADNVAITNAEVKTTIPLVGELMDVTVSLRNTGRQTRNKHPVQVVLNEVRSGQLVVDLKPGEQKTVEFQVAPTEAGHQQGYAEIERDDRPGDNRFYFHAYIPAQVRVLLIQPPDQAGPFIRTALVSLAEANPHIRLRQAPPTDLGWQPADYDYVIVNMLSEVPRLLPRKLDEFAISGGTVIIIPGPDETGAAALQALAAQLDLPPMDVAPQTYSTPLGLDSKALRRSLLRQVFTREVDLKDLPTVTKLYPVRPRGSDEVVLWLEGGRPVLTRSSSGEGTLFLYALPFDLQWTDMPLRGSFIPMWHRLIYWRPGNRDLADIRVGALPRLSISPRQATAPLSMVGPGNVTSLVIPDIRTRTVVLRGLGRPGIYTLYMAEAQDESGGETGTAQRFRVNIPGRELLSGNLRQPDLAGFFSLGQAFFLTPGTDINQWIQQARFGRELWRPLLYILIVILVLELFYSNAYQSPRRRS